MIENISPWAFIPYLIIGLIIAAKYVAFSYDNVARYKNPLFALVYTMTVSAVGFSIVALWLPVVAVAFVAGVVKAVREFRE